MKLVLLVFLTGLLAPSTDEANIGSTGYAINYYTGAFTETDNAALSASAY